MGDFISGKVIFASTGIGYDVRCFPCPRRWYVLLSKIPHKRNFSLFKTLLLSIKVYVFGEVIFVRIHLWSQIFVLEAAGA